MTVQFTKLPNGLRVVTDTMKAVETVSVGSWVGVGARHEAPQINGISHVLEHMVFKGTRRRNARTIVEEIENVGGQINAYTSREYTAYYAKVLKENTSLAVDILADILQHSLLDSEELAREQTVILQEIHQAYDTPDDIVFDYFQEAAFPGQPLGQPVLGTEKRIQNLHRQHLLTFRETMYAAPSMVLSASGKIDHDVFVEMVSKAFNALPATMGSFDPLPARYVGGEQRQERDQEQVNLLIGFEGLSYQDPDYYTLSVLSTLFGGGMSSRLFQEIREKQGLVYSIYSYLSSYIDSGLFAIYANTGAQEVKKLLPLICSQITKLGHDIQSKELNRAKAQLKASILMAMESTGARCEQRARQIMAFGHPLATEDIIKKIEVVDHDRIQHTIGKILSTPLTLAAIGPLHSLEPLDAIAARITH